MADIALIVGIIGNVTSVMVYASPIPTFWYICKKKSTECFSALPYVCTLLTVLLGLYYGSIKENGMLIITINIIGLTFEAIYLAIFLVYASKFSRAKTFKQIFLVLVFFGLAAGFTQLFTHGKLRVNVVGSLCSAVAISMYAAPLSIMRLVIRTKNVEFMPATLSAFLALNGSLWSGYAFFIRDIFIGIPSVLGSVLATVQVIIYFCYKNAKRPEETEKPQQIKMNELKLDIIPVEELANGIINGEEDSKHHQNKSTSKVADMSQTNGNQLPEHDKHVLNEQRVEEEQE